MSETTYRPSAPRRVLQAAMLSAWLAFAPSTQAAPESALDPVMKLLAEKGLVPAGARGGVAGTPAVDVALETAGAANGLMSRVRERASHMVVTAMNFVGVRYRRGGETVESGFDCSGFTRHVFDLSAGLMLPRRADQQARAPGFVAVGRDALQPGDLVFFNTMKRAFSHVGIYIGGGRFVHSPSAGGEVRTDDIGLAYWARRFSGARRVDSVPDLPAATTVDAAAAASLASGASIDAVATH